MVIANPYIDVVFKALMEDERIVRNMIAVFLDEHILKAELIPEMGALRDEEGAGFMIVRWKFLVSIANADGSQRQIFVEIQKPRDKIDMLRLRSFLQRMAAISGESVASEQQAQVVTIYFLCFDLPEITSSVIKVNRQYIDLLSHEVLTQRSEFIEKLSHDCYVVQLRRIKGRVQTKLEKLLSVFEQAYFVDEYGIVKEYRMQTDDADLNHILDKLHYAGTEPAERKED